MYESIVGAVAAAIVGGLIAWGIAYRQYKWGAVTTVQGTKRERAHDARLAVEAVISKLEDSELYRVSPHYEIWDKGFNSLDQTRFFFQTAKAHLRTIGEADVLNLIEKFQAAHRPLIQLRDRFDSFMAEKGYDGIQRRSMAQEWPDLARAADELRRLQDFVRSELRALKELASARLGNA